MEILKINGAAYLQSDSAKKEAYNLSGKRILLEDDTPVFQFIDNAGLDGNSIHKIRAAREILFYFNTCLKHKPTGKVLQKPTSLSELIQRLDEAELPDYRFVLETENKEVLSKIIQHLLYLDIDIEVMLKKEEAEIRKMELFMELAGELGRALESAKSGIEQLMRYINYIAMEKAHIELFNHKMSIVDKKLGEFRQDFIDNLLGRLEEDSNALENTISDITQFTGAITEAVKQDFHPGEFLDKIEKDIGLAHRSLGQMLPLKMIARPY